MVLKELHMALNGLYIVPTNLYIPGNKLYVLPGLKEIFMIPNGLNKIQNMYSLFY
jgi:hypothetical protein